MGEVAAFAQVLTHVGLLTTIQNQVQFARARFGTYDTIDFVVVLLGYALSGERTLDAYYARLAPFAEVFMALFERDRLPDRSTLSRFLSALDQTTVEALRTQFQADLLARPSFVSLGGLWDRFDQQYVVVDVDGTRQAARQRALPHLPSLPAPHRRFAQVAAPGYKGREAWGSRANPHHASASPYASIPGYVWGTWQRRLPGRIEAGSPGHHQVRHDAQTPPRPNPGAARWLVWQCRCPQRYPGRRCGAHWALS
jgi:hypothetical protein